MIKNLRTFLTFDAPLEMKHIRTHFAATHSQYQQIMPEWGHISTRQKLIANYWFTTVPAHFAAMISLPLILLSIVTSHFKAGYLAIALIVVLFYFIIMLFISYWPSFVSNFLPKLEVIVSNYQQEQQQQVIRQLKQQLAAQQERAKFEQEQIIEKFQTQLSNQQTRLLKQQETIQIRFQQKLVFQQEKIEQQQEVIKKCRQAQLSNFALTLIYYAFVKAAGNDPIKSNDHTANLLLKLYGVDRGSLRTNLELIAGSSSKRKNMGERKCTEIHNRFEEAFEFFKEMGFHKGISLLNDLEIKIMGK